MSITNKFSTWLVVTGFLCVSALMPSRSDALGIPGSSIPESGTPNFTNTISLRANKGDWTISGKKNFFFDDKVTLYSAYAASYDLSATFDNAGNFDTGTLSITGKITGLTGGGGPKLLVTADLISFDFDAMYDNTLIGFGTDNIVCSPLLGVTCTTSESIWILLDAPYLGDPNAKFKVSGTAITTIPLPAAAWLLGSGLAILGATAGRKRNA